MEEDINNPWIVENIEVFHYYCCPECEKKFQECHEFQNHAINEHPKAKVLFAKSEIKNEQIKDEHNGSHTELEVEHQNENGIELDKEDDWIEGEEHRTDKGSFFSKVICIFGFSSQI